MMHVKQYCQMCLLTVVFYLRKEKFTNICSSTRLVTLPCNLRNQNIRQEHSGQTFFPRFMVICMIVVHHKTKEEGV